MPALRRSLRAVVLVVLIVEARGDHARHQDRLLPRGLGCLPGPAGHKELWLFAPLDTAPYHRLDSPRLVRRPALASEAHPKRPAPVPQPQLVRAHPVPP
jgi:hypothetical protein